MTSIPNSPDGLASAATGLSPKPGRSLPNSRTCAVSAHRRVLPPSYDPAVHATLAADPVTRFNSALNRMAREIRAIVERECRKAVA